MDLSGGVGDVRSTWPALCEERIKLTGVDAASPTPDAFSAGRCFVNTEVHRAEEVAGPPLCTVIRIKFQPNQADRVEQRVKSALRTKGEAKKDGEETVPQRTKAARGGQVVQIDQGRR